MAVVLYAMPGNRALCCSSLPVESLATEHRVEAGVGRNALLSHELLAHEQFGSSLPRSACLRAGPASRARNALGDAAPAGSSAAGSGRRGGAPGRRPWEQGARRASLARCSFPVVCGRCSSAVCQGAPAATGRMRAQAGLPVAHGPAVAPDRARFLAAAAQGVTSAVATSIRGKKTTDSGTVILRRGAASSASAGASNGGVQVMASSLSGAGRQIEAASSRTAAVVGLPAGSPANKQPEPSFDAPAPAGATTAGAPVALPVIPSSTARRVASGGFDLAAAGATPSGQATAEPAPAEEGGGDRLEGLLQTVCAAAEEAKVRPWPALQPLQRKQRTRRAGRGRRTSGRPAHQPSWDARVPGAARV